MILQLPSFSDVSSDKRVIFEFMALIEKKSSKPIGKLRRKLYVLIDEKPPKFNEKTRRKTEGSFNEITF